jgi:ATP-dependent exoDNAse (exonuclease V) beta subunit
MKGTIYENNYEEEHQQNIVDNLNLLYVAFTRAVSRLYVYGRRKSSASTAGWMPEVQETGSNPSLPMFS